jgi:hypothetical protein
MKKICLLLVTILGLTPLAGQVSVFQLGTAPTIDGTIGAGEWSNASVALSIDQFQLGSDPGASDISGTVRLAWDATNLYALFEITDDIRGQDSADGTSPGPPLNIDSFDDDSVELNFGNTWPGTGDLNDAANFQYRMNPGTNSELEIFRTGTDTGVVWSSSGATSYLVEFQVPWSTLGVIGASPTIGDSFAFNAAINDDDDGGTRETQSFWMATDDQAWFEAGQWGEITLAAAIPEPSSVAFLMGLSGITAWLIVKRRKNKIS